MRLYVIPILLTMQCACAGEVIVSIKKAPESCAPLMVAMFASPESFLNQPDYKERVEAAAGAVVRFSNIPSGRYAVSAFCDNNRNGELDKAGFGWPIEPVGVSRNAKGRMGPPRFEDAAFVVGADPVNISLTLK